MLMMFQVGDKKVWHLCQFNHKESTQSSLCHNANIRRIKHGLWESDHFPKDWGLNAPSAKVSDFEDTGNLCPECVAQAYKKGWITVTAGYYNPWGD